MRDLNVAVARFDDRRVKVIAAVDTTIVSPLTVSGVVRSLGCWSTEAWACLPGSCLHRLCREPDLLAVAWPQQP